jgi:hypothetical protein
MKFDLKEYFKEKTKLSLEIIDSTPDTQKNIKVSVYKNNVDFADNTYKHSISFSENIIHSSTILTKPDELSKFDGNYNKVIVYVFEECLGDLKFNCSLIKKVFVCITDLKINIFFIDINEIVKCRIAINNLNHTVITNNFPDLVYIKSGNIQYNNTFF